MKVLLSPSETRLRDRFGTEGLTCGVPESMGADIVLYTPCGIYGAQRKEFPHDFISSMYDGRLARETGLMAANLDFYEVILEGEEEYDKNNNLVMNYKAPRMITWSQVQGMKLSLRYVRGINIVQVRNIADTARYIQLVDHYFNQEKHVGLFRRPTGKGSWGPMSKNETWLWILQGFPNVGPGLADNILGHFGSIPLKWTCSLDEMMEVPKIGKSRAEKLFSYLVGEKQEKHSVWSEFQATCTRRVFGNCWEIKSKTGQDVKCSSLECPLWQK